MRLTTKSCLILTGGLSVLAFSLPQTASKAPNPQAGNPFAGKMQRQQPGPATAAKQRAFEADLKKLPGQIVAFKEKAVREMAPSSPPETALARLSQISGGNLQVSWNENRTIPIFIKGSRLQENALAKVELARDAAVARQAISFLVENAGLLQIADPAEEFSMIKIERDSRGFTHVRYQQTYQGLVVWGRDVWVHLDRNGVVESFNGRYLPTPGALATNEVLISEAAARETALNALGAPANEISSRRLIYVDENEAARVAWLVNLKYGLAENWYHFIDAKNGATLRRYNHVMSDGPTTGTGVDLRNRTRNLNIYQIGNDYALIDASKPMFRPAESTFPDKGKGVIYVFDARNGSDRLYYVASTNRNSWSSRAGVSASANGALVYDYYKQVHGREAIDGAGSTMNLVVNFKQNLNNAFWNGQFMLFGNGDGNAFSDMAAALDVTAHEMSHGVIEHTANLVYENQSGALNESFADVFGALFEFWVEGNNGDWLMGEDVTTPNIAGDALRDMANPGSQLVAFGGQQPARMSEYRNLPNTEQGDNGGVHINSGIPNRAFYLFATAVGLNAAERIYYRALSNYLTRNARFIDCRLAVIKAAEDLHGAGSAQAVAAGQAFDGVEIFNDGGTPPPRPLPPVQGTEYLAVIDAGNGGLVRATTNAQQLVRISLAPLRSRPTITDNGNFILYVDGTGNIHLLASDGRSDQTLTSSGGFNNIAISPNGRFLAVTSAFVEARVYIADLGVTNPSLNPFQLYTPTYAQGENTGNILFPDRIDWAADNQRLMYDALNIYVDTNGDTTGYWDINLLRTTDGNVERLFPPQPPGVNIGNAVFASNTDNIIAFDYVDPSGNVRALAVDLNAGNVGVITNNFNSLSSPAFSRDDQRVYYHYIVNGNASVWFVDLQADGLTGSGNDAELITGGIFPVSFTVGQRPPSRVESKETSVPRTLTLAQNYPNPFNPETTIHYAMPWSGQMSLAIYDVNGRRVATLESGFQHAGEHLARWNGLDGESRRVTSGVYFYRLEATSPNGVETMLTKKLTVLK